MNKQQKHILMLRGTDIDGALDRLNQSEELYLSCIEEFLNDTTVPELCNFLSKGMWDEAFTNAHALKGLAGNLGFIPLMHSTARLVILIRGGRLSEINDCLIELKSCYRDITDAINEVINISNTEKGRVQ